MQLVNAVKSPCKDCPEVAEDRSVPLSEAGPVGVFPSRECVSMSKG